MTDVRSLNRDVAKQQPADVFATPLEIVNEVLLTKGEKLATLERWRMSVLDELKASDEGMATRGYRNGADLPWLVRVGMCQFRKVASGR